MEISWKLNCQVVATTDLGIGRERKGRNAKFVKVD